MSFKNTLKNYFLEKDFFVIESRVKASRFTFTLTALLFFLSYFFIAAGFYGDFFSLFLPYLYVLLILSFFLHLSIFSYSYLKDKKNIFKYVIALIFLLFVLVLYPFIIFFFK